MKCEWDGGRLTKKRALFLCWQLWEWLAETGGEWKSDWPEWGENNGEVLHMLSKCPCCEYAHSRGWLGADCSNLCLLNSLWSNGCCAPKSPFVKWDNAFTSQTRKKYARIIANAAKEKYEAIK